MQTTFLKKKRAMPSQDFDRCHNGNGAIHWRGILDGNDPDGKRVNFIHDDVLPPNTSIGLHAHKGNQEYYYIIFGNGVMTLDGKEHDVSAGDITVVFPGGTHGLVNRVSCSIHNHCINKMLYYAKHTESARFWAYFGHVLSKKLVDEL